MLKLFRKKIVSRIILWGLLILILPAFVMWGSASMSSRSKDKGPNYVGIVNNRKVSFEEMYYAITGVRSQVILNYFNQPNVLEMILGNKPILIKSAWDRILFLDEAKRLNIKVSDKEVVEYINNHPLFSRNGVFDERIYSYILHNNIGLEARAFEEVVRKNLAIRKMSLYLTKGMKITDEDVLSDYKKEFAKMKIAYILIDAKNFSGDVTIDKNAAKDFYEKHKSELKLKAGAKETQPDRAATFEESKDTIEKYLKETEAGKILKEKTDDIYNKITARMADEKETFENAASRLKFTVKNTDFFSKTDKMDDIGDVPLIAAAGSDLKEFEVSKPVKITRGFIIFEVTEKKPPDEEAFKKDKDEYTKKVREKKLDAFMGDYLRKLEDKAKLAVKLEDIEKNYK